MDDTALMEALLDLACRLGIEVRKSPLGGSGGGLCVLKGKRVLFLDTLASAAEQAGKTAESMAGLEELDSQYIMPAVREALEKWK